MQNINAEHPDYIARKGVWKKYGDLYAGGEQIKTDASDYLIRRQKEPAEVYSERLNRVFYENYIGSIIDWYAATLFRREPIVHVEGPNDDGRRFFADFAEDCDLKGTKLTDFFRRQVVDAMIYGTSIALVDFPRMAQPRGSRAEEDAMGASRAYLTQRSPDALINWSFDERGNYEWVVIRDSYMWKESVESDRWINETRWLYYTKQEYAIYRSVNTASGRPDITLVDQGRHGLANQNRVPVFEMRVPEGMWLMNKAGLLQLEHFNKSNALSWALTMGLFATPVVYSDRDWSQIVGESYFIQLSPGDKFGWTEPEGKVFQIAADNLSRLQEEIYRVCYLMTQSGGPGTQSLPQSGISKQRDFAIAQEVLRTYGDFVKDSMKRMLRSIEAAREDNLLVDVSGLDDFDIGDFSTDLADAKNLLSLGISSITLKKQLFKRLAFKYLCDVRQDVKDQIAQEIEASLSV